MGGRWNQEQSNKPSIKCGTVLSIRTDAPASPDRTLSPSAEPACRHKWWALGQTNRRAPAITLAVCTISAGPAPTVARTLALEGVLFDLEERFQYPARRPRDRALRATLDVRGGPRGASSNEYFRVAVATLAALGTVQGADSAAARGPWLLDITRFTAGGGNFRTKPCLSVDAAARNAWRNRHRSPSPCHAIPSSLGARTLRWSRSRMYNRIRRTPAAASCLAPEVEQRRQAGIPLEDSEAARRTRHVGAGALIMPHGATGVSTANTPSQFFHDAPASADGRRFQGRPRFGASLCTGRTGSPNQRLTLSYGFGAHRKWQDSCVASPVSVLRAGYVALQVPRTDARIERFLRVGAGTF
jgi:hypothetical protein